MQSSIHYYKKNDYFSKDFEEKLFNTDGAKNINISKNTVKVEQYLQSVK